METDRSYYARRAADERRAALGAADPDIRRRHLELSALLSARVDAPGWPLLCAPIHEVRRP